MPRLTHEICYFWALISNNLSSLGNLLTVVSHLSNSWIFLQRRWFKSCFHHFPEIISPQMSLHLHRPDFIFLSCEYRRCWKGNIVWSHQEKNGWVSRKQGFLITCLLRTKSNFRNLKIISFYIKIKFLIQYIEKTEKVEHQDSIVVCHLTKITKS